MQMPYNPCVHGPLHIIDLGVNDLQFVYWDIKPEEPKQFYGWTIMPSSHPRPPSRFEWWENQVTVFAVDKFHDTLRKLKGDQLELMKGSGYNFIMPGNKLLVRMHAEWLDDGHCDRLIMMEPRGPGFPQPIIARTTN